MITVTVEFTEVDGVDVLQATYHDDCDPEIGWSGAVNEDSVLGEQLCAALVSLARIEEINR